MMRIPTILLLVGFIIMISACSAEPWKHAGYDLLQEIQEMQCKKDISRECPKRETYAEYQRKLKNLDESE